MKLNIKTIITGSLVVLLTGCSTTSYQNNFLDKVIKHTTLANGQVVSFGYAEPEPGWECTLVNEQTYNMGVLKMKGITDINGLVGQLNDEGEKLIIANKWTKVNYMYNYIPDDTSVMGIDIGNTKSAKQTLYACKYRPLDRV